MKNLIKAINSSKPFLVDYSLAKQHIEMSQKYGMTDMITQLFGESPEPYMVNSTCVIPIYGMIGKCLSPMESIGCCDVEELDDWIDEALCGGCTRIIFDINSDGGCVDGVEEIANKIRGLPVETIAYSSGSMNSAAYWIGSACDRVITSLSACVGSIGCYVTFTDLSAAAAAQGISVQVFKSGELKGAGIAGTSLSEAQAAYIQSEVDTCGNTFKAAVMMKRKYVKAEDMQGQSFSGKIAATKGLVTGLSPSLKELLKITCQ